MIRVARIASLLLVIGVVVQVVWAEAPFLRGARTPDLPPTGTAVTLETPTSRLIRAHVPPGQRIVYVTPGHGNGELYYYFLLSAALVARNQVWWAAPAPSTAVTDWWRDVSGGAPAVSRLAARVGARYVVYAGGSVPADLSAAAVWRLPGTATVVELGTAERR